MSYAYRKPTIFHPPYIAIPYQEEAVSAAAEAIAKHGNTLINAPTGAGKTIIAAVCIQTFLKPPVLFLQHTDNLLGQNRTDAIALNPGLSITTFDDEGGHDFSGDVVFAVVNTAHKRLDTLAARRWGSIVIDEGHRAAGEMYSAIVRRIAPDHLLALSATPERPDKTPLPEAGITNCCIEIPLDVLWEAGRLVKPRLLSAAIGGEERQTKRFGGMRNARSEASEALAAEELADEAIIGAVCRYGPTLKTIWACTTVAQARRLAGAFTAAGLPARAVWGASKTVAEDLAWHKAQAPGSGAHLFSVIMLTEGYNDPSIEAVGILRRYSHRSPLKQFLGRGLRCSAGKTSCAVFDFLGVFDDHPDVLEPSLFLTTRPRKGEAPTKECKGCGFLCHMSVSTCPSCGRDFPVRVEAKNVSLHVVLEEVPLRKESKWRWVDLGPRTVCAMTYGAVGMAYRQEDGTWHAYTRVYANAFQRKTLGYTGTIQPVLEHTGSREACIAVLDARLSALPNPGGSHSEKRAPWMMKPPSQKQIDWANQIKAPLPATLNGKRMTSYAAALWIQGRLLLKALHKK